MKCECCGGPSSGERCEACEGALRERPSGRLARVWSGFRSLEAELLRVELRRAGIASVLENEGGVAFAVGIATPAVPYVITVAEADAPRALDVLRSATQRSEVYVPPVAMIRFPCRCGKELEVPPDFRGLEMDCPFCGRPTRAGSPGER